MAIGERMGQRSRLVTADTYNGGNGYSLRLRGLEEGVNDMAWDRLIVLHGASYVSQEAVKALGRLGRSANAPAGRRTVGRRARMRRVRAVRSQRANRHS